MNADIPSMIKALKYAVYLCECKRLPFKAESYKVACDEIKISLEASISRLENGEEMESIAYVQENV